MNACRKTPIIKEDNEDNYVHVIALWARPKTAEIEANDESHLVVILGNFT